MSLVLQRLIDAHSFLPASSSRLPRNGPRMGFYSWSRTLASLWTRMDGQTGFVQVMSVDDRLLQGQGEIGDPITHVLNLDVILTVIHGARPPRPSRDFGQPGSVPARCVLCCARGGHPC